MLFEMHRTRSQDEKEAEDHSTSPSASEKKFKKDIDHFKCVSFLIE